MATQWANVCAATLGQVRCGAWPGICATKAKKQLTNEYFASHKRGKSKGFCLFVCATKYFCAAIAHKRESGKWRKFSNFPEGNCHHASWLVSSLCHPPLSALYLFCLCKQTRTSVNSSRSAHKHLTLLKIVAKTIARIWPAYKCIYTQYISIYCAYIVCIYLCMLVISPTYIPHFLTRPVSFNWLTTHWH